jgi:hypothetical protein
MAAAYSMDLRKRVAKAWDERTQLRKAGTPQDLQKQWIGHSSLRTGDRYSHTHEEVEYRESAAGNVGLDRVLSPKQSPREAPTCQSGLVLKPTV